MKKLCLLFIPITILFSSVVTMVAAGGVDRIKSGELYHVTACKDGIPMEYESGKPVTLVNLLDRFLDGKKLEVIGYLGGRGRPERGLDCQGAMVRVLEIKAFDPDDPDIKTRNDLTYVKIKTIVGGNMGWVSKRNIGRWISVANCKKATASEPEYIPNCLGK